MTFLLPLLTLLGCSLFEGAPPPPPVLAIVAPLSGENRALGEQVVAGATLAADDTFTVRAVDEAAPGGLAALAADPEVIAAVALPLPAAAARLGEAWRAAGLPVLALSDGAGLPTVVASDADLLPCATAFLPRGGVILVHDGSEAGLGAVPRLQDLLGARVVGVLGQDPITGGADAARVGASGARAVLYLGRTRQGGDFLRALRILGGDISFLAVGANAVELLRGAGHQGEGAVVVTPDRPLLARGPRDAWVQRYGDEAPGAARNAYDAAALWRAAWRAASRPDQRPDRATLAAALETTAVQGFAGPLTLGPDGHPSPPMCTAYTIQGEALQATGAAALDAQQHVRLLDAEAGQGVTPPPPGAQ